MVKLELNGKPYQCAACKEELTIGQYQSIIKDWGIDKPDLLDRDNIGLFTILTNSPFKVVAPDNDSEQAIWESIIWVMGEEFNYPVVLPTVLEIEGKSIEIPKKIGSCSIGQNIVLKQLIDRSKYLNESISMATAIYLQPLYSGGKKEKFDYKKAKELEVHISRMPAELIYPIGFFLLVRARKFGEKQSKLWPRIKNSLNMRLKWTLPGWHKSINYQSTTD